MAITIDGKTLNVSRLSESVDVIAVETDAWENEQYKRKVRVFGTVKRWTLDCYEQNVNWVDSVAKHLQEKAKQGSALSFIVNEGSTHQINTSVYILSVNLNYEGGVADYRAFSVALQKAM